MKKLLLTTAISFSCFAASLMAQSPVGIWKTIDDETGKAKSHLEIFESNGKFGGKIVKLLNKPENSLCDKCSGDDKNKPLMGMVLVKGLYLKDGYWQGGTIMDPNKGSSYGCSFWFETGNADILNVKGKHWSGISRTQKWYRVK